MLEIHYEGILKHKNKNLGILFAKVTLKKIPTICVFQPNFTIIFCPKAFHISGKYSSINARPPYILSEMPIFSPEFIMPTCITSTRSCNDKRLGWEQIYQPFFLMCESQLAGCVAVTIQGWQEQMLFSLVMKSPFLHLAHWDVKPWEIDLAFERAQQLLCYTLIFLLGPG